MHSPAVYILTVVPWRALTVDTPGGTNYADVAEYTCNPGYYINGNSRRQCSDTGFWTGSTPICKIHDCGSLGKPENGVVSYLNTTYGAVATYKCDTSYTFVGNLTRTCGENGNWSSTQPRCDSQRAFALALGLGLGIGLFLIMMMIIVIVLIYLYKKRYRQNIQTIKRRPTYYNVIDPGMDYYQLYMPDDPGFYPPEVDVRSEKKPAPTYSIYDTGGRTSYGYVQKLGKDEYLVPYNTTEDRPRSSTHSKEGDDRQKSTADVHEEAEEREWGGTRSGV